MNSTSSPLLKTATRGVAWTLLVSLCVLTASVVSQLILGWLLSKHDFGVYAISIAFFHVARVFNDGGVGLWLARLSRQDYDNRVGHAFWLGLLFSLATTVLVLLAAWPVSRLYGEPQIVTMFLLLLLTLPFNSFRNVVLPGLQVQLEFGKIATSKFLSALTRYVLVVVFAWRGFGPYSFVLAALGSTVTENAYCFCATRIRPWRTRFDMAKCREILAESRWSLSGTLFEAVLTQVDYAVLGILVSTEVVGVYFFAYQVTVQLVLLFSESLRRVVLPVFARVEPGSSQEQTGLVLSGRCLGLIACPCLLLLTVVMRPLESVLWHGRWAEAVVPIQLLAAVMPLQLLSMFAEMLAQSRGKFRLWTVAVGIRGLGCIVAACIAGSVSPQDHVGVIASVMAVYVLVSGLAESILILDQLRLPWSDLLRAKLPGYFCCVVVALTLLLLFQHDPRQPIVDLFWRVILFCGAITAVGLLAFRPALTQILSVLRSAVGSQESPT